VSAAGRPLELDRYQQMIGERATLGVAEGTIEVGVLAPI
jgi:hypothetical protein